MNESTFGSKVQSGSNISTNFEVQGSCWPVYMYTEAQTNMKHD